MFSKNSSYVSVSLNQLHTSNGQKQRYVVDNQSCLLCLEETDTCVSADVRWGYNYCNDHFDSKVEDFGFTSVCEQFR